MLIGIDEKPADPGKFLLSQNYPNPFNPTTTIAYELPKSADVTIEILDILGRRIDLLISAKQDAGHYAVTWDGKDKSSGIYFYRIQAGDFTETKKMLLLK
jgi:flagellar hook assembly protein FlgD